MANFIQPFTAAWLEKQSAEKRDDELMRRGMKFLRESGLIAWDGKDPERAMQLATIAYENTLRVIAKAAATNARRAERIAA